MDIAYHYIAVSLSGILSLLIPLICYNGNPDVGGIALMYMVCQLIDLLSMAVIHLGKLPRWISVISRWTFFVVNCVFIGVIFGYAWFHHDLNFCNEMIFPVITTGSSIIVLYAQYRQLAKVIPLPSSRIPDVCGICLEPVDKKSVASLVCRHTYHQKCIRQLIPIEDPFTLELEGVKCPTCRVETPIAMLEEPV